jgi:pyruvate dehydrogenase E2 component (dihydrolipoamide acetyltransferase)
VLVVETDKVETEVETPAAGRLHQLAAPGTTAPCGAVIGLLLDAGEQPPSPGTGDDAAEPAASGATQPAPAEAGTSGQPIAAHAGAPTDGRLLASPNARRVAAAAGIPLATVRGTGPGGRIVSEDVEELLAARGAGGLPPSVPAPSPAAARTVGSPPATVAARQLADLLGVDLAAVAPEPGDGRITRDGVARHVRELLAAIARPATPPVAAPAPDVLPPATQVPTRVLPFRGVRGTIAKRMHASLREMAQLTLHMDADLDAVVADRRERAAAGTAPGYTDYVIAAAARALREHYVLNAQVVDPGIALLPDIHVGIAVAVPDGLVVPVVRHADWLPLDELAATTTRLAEAARTKQLALEDLEGGTFSVSALGMYGVDGFTPIVNPPNVAVLGVGRIRDDVVLVGDEVATVKRATLSLTWDHRVLDGAPAAEFCRAIVDHLADPRTLAGTG